ncbi:MAG TPA: hypothetical protein VHT51_18390 [Micropepsaceae bacterium]|nr:hypothetical protein [Micropepsaceae bacterium]
MQPAAILAGTVLVPSTSRQRATDSGQNHANDQNFLFLAPGAFATGERLRLEQALEIAMDWGGWMWFVIDVLAVAVLGCTMAYGVVMWRTRPRDAASEKASDEATRRLYHPNDDIGNKPLTR